MTVTGLLLTIALTLIAADVLLRILALDPRNNDYLWLSEVTLWGEIAAWACVMLALWLMPRAALLGT